MLNKSARKKELAQDMLTPWYLSRTQELIDRFGYVTSGMLERRFCVQQFYAEFLIEHLRNLNDPMQSLWGDAVKSAEQIAKENYARRNP